MSRRIVINVLAAAMVMLGGVSLSFAASPRSPVSPNQVCSGGGGTCSCDAGQACVSSALGCSCRN